MLHTDGESVQHPRKPAHGLNPRQFDLVDYGALCGVSDAQKKREVSVVPEISPEGLLAWRARGKRHLLNDVKEPNQFGICETGGNLEMA